MASAHKVRLRVVTTDAQILDTEADLVVAPGGAGELGIQARHIPLVTTLKPGELRVRQADDEHVYALSGGFMQVQHEGEGSLAIVLARAAELADKIDVSRAEAARRRAEERLAQAQEQVDTARAEAALNRAINRLKIADRRRASGTLPRS
jgi:F-type H+-transporting ATPase subunit epsilon